MKAQKLTLETLGAEFARIRQEQVAKKVQDGSAETGTRTQASVPQSSTFSLPESTWGGDNKTGMF